VRYARLASQPAKIIGGIEKMSSPQDTIRECPFCRGRAALDISGEFVTCSICLADGPVAEDAIAAWERRAEAVTDELIASTTYSLHHNPNCPKPYLVRLPQGVLDLKSYAETKDACGFGTTFAEAFANARDALSKVSPL
jgi:hypothetical protein